MESSVTKENEKCYLKKVSLDIEYFGKTYRKAKIKKSVDGKSASQLADELKELLLNTDYCP